MKRFHAEEVVKSDMADTAEVMDKFMEIKNAKGSKAKEAVIAKYKDDKPFVKALHFVFNPFITTGLAKKKMQKDVGTINPSIKNLTELLEYIEKNNTGRDEDIQQVQSFIKSDFLHTRQFLTELVTKDITIGVSAKTVNKVIPGLIPEYKVQHAKRWEDNCHKIKNKFAVTLKEDGIRCTVFNLENSCKAYTRQGNEIEQLTDIIDQISKYMPKGYIFDGELVADIERTDYMHSKDIFRKTSSIVLSKNEKKGLNLVLFDVVPYGEYLKGKSSRDWLARQESLNNMLDSELMPNILKVQTLYVGDDKSEVEEHFEEVVRKGCEGLVMCDTRALYETKRVNSIQKLKPCYDADLRIVGYKEHKHGEKMGAIIVDYKGYEVSVGTGFDDQLRKELWEQREDLIGKIAEVQYLNESKNENEELSLRHPVFVRIRDDKDEPSYD